MPLLSQQRKNSGCSLPSSAVQILGTLGSSLGLGRGVDVEDEVEEETDMREGTEARAEEADLRKSDTP